MLLTMLTRAAHSGGVASLLIVAILALADSSAGQLYRSSVVGTDFDYIRSGDPDAFHCLEFKDRGWREMPDKRGGGPLKKRALIFVASFEDGTSVDIAIDAAFETEKKAHAEALRYVPRLGKLPTSLRRGVKRLVVHAGGRDTTAFSDEGLIVVYADNATKRIGTHDLEETIFHESVHAAWDKQHASSPAWQKAQKDDDGFVTNYAKKNPRGEDLAESALFAFTLLHYPKRIPADDSAKIRRTIPKRIAFVKTLLPPGKPLMYPVGPKYACDGSGQTFNVSAPRLTTPKSQCTVNIKTTGGMNDIVSNALMLGLGRDGTRVQAFLKNSNDNYPNGEALLVAAAKHFKVPPPELRKQVKAYLHCNCNHD